jgi:hypothetical protein
MPRCYRYTTQPDRERTPQQSIDLHQPGARILLQIAKVVSYSVPSHVDQSMSAKAKWQSFVNFFVVVVVVVFVFVSFA